MGHSRIFKKNSFRGYFLIFEISTILFLLYLLLNLSYDSSSQVIKGEADFSNFNFTKPLPLNGEWGFKRNQLPPSSHTNIPLSYREVPEFWGSGLIPYKSNYGVASYYLTVKLPKSYDSLNDPLALTIKNITPNYDLWINGSSVHMAGRVANNKEESRSGNSSFTYLIPRDIDILNIQIGISNFHDIAAGINHSIFIGPFYELQKREQQHIILDSLALGAIFFIGLYNIFLFFLTKRKRQNLYLSIICFLIFFFAGLKEEMVLLTIFPCLNGALRTRLIYISLNTIGFFIYFYGQEIYPHIASKPLNIFSKSYVIILTFFCLFFPSYIYTRFLFIMELISFGFLVFLFIKISISSLKRNYIGYNFIQLLVFTLASCIFAGILNELRIVNFSSMALVFLILILAIIFMQAWELSHRSQKIIELEQEEASLVEEKKALELISQEDSLTGLGNRRRLKNFIDSLWVRRWDTPFSIGVIMIDIDFFKAYNDYYGHQKGDRCLSTVAMEISKVLHRKNDLLVRYGGEEFIIILSDISRDDLIYIAEKIRLSIVHLSLEHKMTLLKDKIVTISLGLSYLEPLQELSSKELIMRADMALYQAKDEGRNCIAHSFVSLD